MMKKNNIIITIVAGVLASIVLFFGLRYYLDHKASNFRETYVFFVYPDTSPEQIKDSLIANAGVKRKGSLVRAFKELNLSETIRPGKYTVDPSSSAIYTARMLAYGWQSSHKLVLAGTMRSKEKIARKIDVQMMVDSATMMSVFTDSLLLSTYGMKPSMLFAYILPDTYYMYWTTSAEDILARIQKEYLAFWTQERLEKAKAQKLSQEQVSILASIVSGETNKVFEYPIIAGVYLNRLRKGMKLQADPTISYIFNYELDRVLKRHLSTDSPYNTYKYIGLPPTPINVPPKECIDAVLNPASHKYLYFCASPEFDGTHNFAATFAEHQKNARTFQRALTIRQREQAQQK